MLSRPPRSLGWSREPRAASCAQDYLLALPPHQQVLAAVHPPPQYPLGVVPQCPIYSLQHPPTVTREYGWPCSQHQHLPRQTAKKVGRRSMMRSGTFSSSSASASASLPPSPTIRFPIPACEKAGTTFTFAVPSPLDMALSFPPRPSPPRVRKRSRAVTDVDGEHLCGHKKKRRLRLFLITSRLSSPYSYPATNIVDRGSSKIAVWAKQKALGRNLLRKAAILNRIRRQTFQSRETEGGGLRRVMVEQEREEKQLEMARLELIYGSHDAHTRPAAQLQRSPPFPPTAAVRADKHFALTGPSAPGDSSSGPSSEASSDDEEERPTYRSSNDAYSYAPPRAQLPRRGYLPLPRSPLGLSNYDALDMEDDIPDPYAHLDDEDESADQDDAMEVTDFGSLSTNAVASYTPAGTGTSEISKTPPQLIYSDFSKLDPGEPVLGDYDGVEEGADPIWPNAMSPLVPPATKDTLFLESPPLIGTSPNFSALFAEPERVVPEVKTDPPFLQSPPPTCVSPNFSVLFSTKVDVETSTAPVAWQGGLSSQSMFDKKEEEIKAERQRQKSFMFLGFNNS